MYTKDRMAIAIIINTIENRIVPDEIIQDKRFLTTPAMMQSKAINGVLRTLKSDIHMMFGMSAEEKEKTLRYIEDSSIDLNMEHTDPGTKDSQNPLVPKCDMRCLEGGYCSVPENEAPCVRTEHTTMDRP